MSKGKRDFDKEALSWDETPARRQLAANIADGIKRVIQLNPDMKVMDFGCGTGLVTLALAPSVDYVTGVDSSAGMLTTLVFKSQHAGIHNVDTRLVNEYGDLDFPTIYDLIVSAMTFHHLVDINRILVQMYEHTVPGGMIAVADLDEDGGLFHAHPDGVYHNGFDRDKLKALFIDTGFVDVQSCTVSEVTKQGADEVIHSFTVFLITGKKPQH